MAWQRPDAPPPDRPKDVVLQYADGSELWRSGKPETPLVRQVFAEAGAAGSLSHHQLSKIGAIVVTTIDSKAQATAIAVLAAHAEAQPSLRASITAVDPASGRIRAYAPGDDPAVDYAGGVLKEPGTAFFPFSVAAALQHGKTLDSTYDGRSPRRFGSGEVKMTVTDNANCGERCTLRDALLKSSNVAMFDMVVNEVGVKAAAAAARQAGVPDAVTIDGEKTQLFGAEHGGPTWGLALGASAAEMRPLDLASAYATFAADGVHRNAHFVTHIIDASGNTLYRTVQTPKPAFDPDPARSKEIANQITAVLKAEPACGAHGSVACRPAVQLKDPQLPDRIPHAWMVAYDQELSVSVFVGSVKPATPTENLPNEIWQAFQEKRRR